VSGGDNLRPQAFDLLAAIGLLTRLPVGLDSVRAAKRGAAAAWAWPFAGVVVGAIGAFTAVSFVALGLDPGSVAAIVIASQVMTTGALHEDGLADTLDGLWGGYDKTRRLEIMKDSRIGTYGVLGLVLVTLLRWHALSLLISSGDSVLALVAAGAVSRAPMAAIMAALPNARGSGLSQSVGRPSVATAGLAAFLAVALGALCVGPAVVIPTLGAAAICLCLSAIAKAKIGGQTGDILGASQQMSEAVFLTILAAATI
jgi:adenosylcobinamide-GDP ribazoletransferase